MKLRVGQTLSSPVDTTTVVVVRAPGEDVELTCAGVPLHDPRDGGPSPEGTADPDQMDGTQLGTRYADDALGLELLVSKPGQGARSRSTAPRCR
jgi:hypothetical protein